jgi:hypothetical protein
MKNNELTTTNELGKLNKESICKEFVALAPKVYSMV